MTLSAPSVAPHSCLARSLVVLAALGTGACVTSVSKYTVPTRIDGAAVDGMHEWDKFGERFRTPGIRNVRPSIAALNRFAEAAGWLSYSDTRACFGVISFQRKRVEYADNTQNIQDNVVDWGASKHTLVTASGATLQPAGPVELVPGDELVVEYDAFDNLTKRWMPAMERYDRAGARICFDTPTPLAQEAWVRWSYTLSNRTRSEFTFQIDAAR